MLMFLGDIHGDFHVVNNLLNKLMLKHEIEPEVIFQVGDFGLYRSILNKMKNENWHVKVPLYVTHGNHEEQLVYDDLVKKGWNHDLPFYVQPQGKIVCVNEEIILSVGGAPCADNPPEWSKVKFRKEDYLDAAEKYKGQKVKFLLTHEAPNGTGRLGLEVFGDPYNCGIPELRTLCEKVKPRYQIGGHYHKFHYVENILEEGECSHFVLPVGQKGCLLYDENNGEEGLERFAWFDICDFNGQLMPLSNPDNLIRLHRNYDGRKNYGY